MSEIDRVIGRAVKSSLSRRIWSGHRESRGRVYQLEETPEVHRNGDVIEPSELESVLESITPNTIYTMERFLRTGRTGYFPAPTPAVRRRIVSEYGIRRQEDITRRNYMTLTDMDRVLEILKSKFPQAEKYKSLKELQYTAQYGDTPCTVYKEDKHKED